MENEQISEAALSLQKYSTIIDTIIEKGYVKHRSHIAAVHPIGNGSYEFSLVFNVNIQCKREYAGDILKKIVQDVFDSEGHVKIIIEKKDNTITVSRASDGMVYKNIELI